MYDFNFLFSPSEIFPLLLTDDYTFVSMDTMSVFILAFQ